MGSDYSFCVALEQRCLKRFGHYFSLENTEKTVAHTSIPQTVHDNLSWHNCLSHSSSVQSAVVVWQSEFHVMAPAFIRTTFPEVDLAVSLYSANLESKSAYKVLSFWFLSLNLLLHWVYHILFHYCFCCFVYTIPSESPSHLYQRVLYCALLYTLSGCINIICNWPIVGPIPVARLLLWCETLDTSKERA